MEKTEIEQLRQKADRLAEESKNFLRTAKLGTTYGEAFVVHISALRGEIATFTALLGDVENGVLQMEGRIGKLEYRVLQIEGWTGKTLNND